MTARAPAAAWGQAAVSVVIVVVLGLQTLAASASIEKRLWPFMNYPMYRRVLYEDQLVNNFVVVGREDDSREVVLEPLDGHYWPFYRTFIRPVITLEYSPADAAARQQVMAYCAAYRQRYGRALTHLRLENQPYRVTRRGLEPAEPSVVGIIPIPPLLEGAS